MGFPSSVVLGLGAAPVPVTAMTFWPVERAVAKPSFAADMANLPLCAVHCLAGDCPLSNATCVCTHEMVTKHEDRCMMKSCTFPEALFARNLTETSCNTPVRNRSRQFTVLNIALGAVTTVVVFIRVLFKRCYSMRRRLGADDWVIAVALVLFALPSIATMIFGLSAHGLGKDIWGLQPAEVTTFALYFYIMEIHYLILMTLIKLTLSLFYLDIFSGKIIRRLLWGTVAFHIAFGIAFLVKVIFQCSPVSFYWRKFDSSQAPHGRCIDINASGWANAAIGVAVDFWLIAIPLSRVKKLNLHWKKKVGAALMFLTGALVTMVSILRLHSIIHFANSTNPTWEQWSIVWWSTIEVNVGMICTSLPSMRLVLLRLWPRVFGNDSRAHKNADSGHGDQQRTDPDFIDEELELGGEDYRSTTEIVKTPTVADIVERPEETSDENPTEERRGGHKAGHQLSIELGERKHTVQM